MGEIEVARCDRHKTDDGPRHLCCYRAEVQRLRLRAVLVDAMRDVERKESKASAYDHAAQYHDDFASGKFCDERGKITHKRDAAYFRNKAKAARTQEP